MKIVKQLDSDSDLFIYLFILINIQNLQTCKQFEKQPAKKSEEIL